MNEKRAAEPEFEVFFDGDCPLCTKEINMLRSRDQHGRIQFTDIASSAFDAMALGVTQGELMAEIHGRTRDGELVKGVEVFRQLYSRVGFELSVALSRWWGVRQLLDWGYRLWAKNRLRFTGRCVDDVCSVS